jgi:ferritin
VSAQIGALAFTARDARDYAAEQFMQWFIAEQIEEVATMSDLLAVARRSRERVSEIEDYLIREQLGEGESSTAQPRVAGGA